MAIWEAIIVQCNSQFLKTEKQRTYYMKSELDSGEKLEISRKPASNWSTI